MPPLKITPEMQQKMLADLKTLTYNQVAGKYGVHVSSVYQVAKVHNQSRPRAKRTARTHHKPAAVDGAGENITISRSLLRALVRLIPSETRDLVLQLLRTEVN